MAKSKPPGPIETIKLPPPGIGQGELRAFGGSASDDFNNILAGQAFSALWTGNSNAEGRQQKIAAAAAALAGVKPADELEGMIAAQMVATHAATMECYRRSMIEGQTFEGRREALNQANKLSRTYAVLVETLDRHRGKGGQQRVTVEHVHVHQGGQAIVGAVTQGGGSSARLEDQPHAPRTITHEPGAPLRRADQVRDPVPIAGNTGT